MLKIIRGRPPAKLQHQCVRYSQLKTSWIPENRDIGHEEDLDRCINQKYVRFSTLIRETRSRSRLLGRNSFSGVYLLSNDNYVCLTQKREFSFQSSIEYFTRTQSGFFQTLSESSIVEYAQHFLSTVHDVSGLPWWGSLVCATIMLRTFITFPVAVYQQYIMAKLHNLQLELPDLVKELKKETAVAVKLYGWDEKTARSAYTRSLRKQYNDLIIRDNCHPFKTALLVLVQLPMWVSVSVGLRNFVYMLPHQDLAAQLTYAQFAMGGFGFIPNLTVPDQSWIFPIALGILNLLIIEIQQLSKPADKPPSKLQKIALNGFRGISILMVPIAASVPSCLALYWTTSSGFGLLQNLTLLSPKVRRAFGIPQTENEVKKPYQLILTNLKRKLKIS